MSEIATNEYYHLYKIHPQGAATKEIEVYRKVNAIEIPDNATNGDVIKAMFPKGKVRREVSCTHDKTVFSFPDGTYFGAECRFNTDWWNAPYKGGQG